MLEDSQVRQLTLDLLKNPGARDTQRLVGASEIGNPCDYCLASRIKGVKRGANMFWMGAKIGTAIHRELEYEQAKHIEVPESYRFASLKGARIEQPIALGVIEGYGQIRSKPDSVLVNDGHLIDWKTSTKKKVEAYKLDGISEQYRVQQNLYAWGLNNGGTFIGRYSLVFINRDGLTDKDVWVYSEDYNEQVALDAWHRLEVLVGWVNAGNDVEELDSWEGCYYCTNILNRI